MESSIFKKAFEAYERGDYKTAEIALYSLKDHLKTLKKNSKYKNNLYAKKDNLQLNRDGLNLEITDLQTERDSLLEDKNSIWEEINSIKSSIEEEYDTFNKYRGKKDDFIEWSKRKKSWSNLWYGKGGEKIPRHSLIWRDQDELDGYFNRMNNAKENIVQLKSEKNDAFERLNNIRDAIGEKNDEIRKVRDEIRKKCNKKGNTKKPHPYVKTKKDKNEIKDLENLIRKIEQKIPS